MQQDTNHRAAVIVALARAAGATVHVCGRDAEEVERIAELATEQAVRRRRVAGYAAIVFLVLIALMLVVLS